jgi:site-specific recombinase XerD
MHTWWQDTTRTAGVRYLKLHTTRHTFATRLIQQGVGMEAVARLLGHESVRTTVDTYVHLVVEDLRNAIGMLEIA